MLPSYQGNPYQLLSLSPFIAWQLLVVPMQLMLFQRKKFWPNTVINSVWRKTCQRPLRNFREITSICLQHLVVKNWNKWFMTLANANHKMTTGRIGSYRFFIPKSSRIFQYKTLWIFYITVVKTIYIKNLWRLVCEENWALFLTVFSFLARMKMNE